MGVKKNGKLDATIEAIQERWGRRTIFRLGERLDGEARRAPVGSGLAALDAALPGGGVPRGRIVELAGAPTAGVVTVALRLVAAVQAQGEAAAYLDLAQAFDPVYAAACAVVLERLLLIYPPDRGQAVGLAQELVAAGAGAVVLDFAAAGWQEGTKGRQDAARQDGGGAPGGARGGAPLGLGWDRLLAPLARAGTLFLVLRAESRLAPGAAASGRAGGGIPHATLRLHLQRERWLYHRHDVYGYRTRVTVVKSRVGGVGESVLVDIACRSLKTSNFAKTSNFLEKSDVSRGER
jgi:recombination protein RecA